MGDRDVKEDCPLTTTERPLAYVASADRFCPNPGLGCVFRLMQGLIQCVEAQHQNSRHIKTITVLGPQAGQNGSGAILPSVATSPS